MPGYGDLANLMVSKPDTGVFRKFSSLNIESLLHMQAELLNIELAIDELRNDSDLNAFDISWLSAGRSSSDTAICSLFERLRGMLDTYC